MKHIRNIFLIPALAFIASCTEDTKMTTYPGRGDEAFFASSGYSYVVSADLEDSYSIEVLRATTVGNSSVPVEIVVEDKEVADAFTSSKTVEFADGEYRSEIKVSFERSKLTIGKENIVKVIVNSETDLPYATECMLSVTRDYTWKDYGTGKYSSGILAQTFGPISWKQKIEVAEEDSKVYRVPDLYHNAGTQYSESGNHLLFTWDGSSTIGFTVPSDEDGCVTVPSGFIHPSYGMVSLYIDPSPEYSGYDSESKTFTFNCCGLVSLGQLYRWANDTFTLD